MLHTCIGGWRWRRSHSRACAHVHTRARHIQRLPRRASPSIITAPKPTESHLALCRATWLNVRDMDAADRDGDLSMHVVTTMEEDEHASYDDEALQQIGFEDDQELRRRAEERVKQLLFGLNDDPLAAIAENAAEDEEAEKKGRWRRAAKRSACTCVSCKGRGGGDWGEGMRGCCWDARLWPACAKAMAPSVAASMEPVMRA